MKTLKFKDFKANWILSGEKSSTLRLFDDKDLQPGDTLDLVNSDTGAVFAQAVIMEVVDKPLGEITDIDLVGHEKWPSPEAMLATHQAYYGQQVNLQTPAKIVRFRLV